MTPEMSRLYPLDRLGERGHFSVTATAEELGPLATRMGIPGIQALSCTFQLRRQEQSAIHATGQLQAAVTQVCVVTLEPFESVVTEDFEVLFVVAGNERDALDLDAMDEIPYTGDVLDLGEATTEQLALALDPFPRKPGATLPATDDGEDEAGMFAALGKLRQRG